MKSILRAGIAIGLLSSPAFSGGWETGRLDTSIMYEEGRFRPIRRIIGRL